MSEISNKAIIIAVSLLVTVAITSSIIMVLGYFKDIYNTVDKTDISLRKMFDEFDVYDNTVMTGLDIVNTYNKYKDNPTVNIFYRSTTTIIQNNPEIMVQIIAINEDYRNINSNNNSESFEKKCQEFLATNYNVTCEKNENNVGNINIYFN